MLNWVSCFQFHWYCWQQCCGDPEWLSWLCSVRLSELCSNFPFFQVCDRRLLLRLLQEPAWARPPVGAGISTEQHNSTAHHGHGHTWAWNLLLIIWIRLWLWLCYLLWVALCVSPALSEDSVACSPCQGRGQWSHHFGWFDCDGLTSLYTQTLKVVVTLWWQWWLWLWLWIRLYRAGHCCFLSNSQGCSGHSLVHPLSN